MPRGKPLSWNEADDRFRPRLPARLGLAIMMYEHTALCGQFACAFGNDAFELLAPLELMVYIIAHHDAGWAEFDRGPRHRRQAGLPYNLIETPAEYITVTSRLSPDFNERQHPFCGLMSSMHSWGLYNGRYGLSDHVLIEKFPEQERPLAERMLNGELARQKRLKEVIGRDPKLAERLDDKKLFQNYKQLQFIDTLALYFNRVHRDERGALRSHTCRSTRKRSRWPFGPEKPGLHAFTVSLCGQRRGIRFRRARIRPGENETKGGWTAVLKSTPTEWERFRLIPA